MQLTELVTSNSDALSKAAVAEAGVYVPVTVAGLVTVSRMQDFLKNFAPSVLTVLLKSEEAF